MHMKAATVRTSSTMLKPKLAWLPFNPLRSEDKVKWRLSAKESHEPLFVYVIDAHDVISGGLAASWQEFITWSRAQCNGFSVVRARTSEMAPHVT